MTKVVTLSLRIEIDVSERVTVSEAKRRIAARLHGAPEAIEWQKGLLPDPETIYRGVIFWDSIAVKQKRAR
ncbi:MAG TPA: hypothetical protein VGN68_04255 [Sphingopyxis sp.]|jgi:hypothetical protein|uniref:hypothetical protein n=1 Tax=Sphingopyxis sp. TaxID=1908224 RepID=UPI002E160A01|nr:hypothetical protein [Sphingopyxis sp.]